MQIDPTKITINNIDKSYIHDMVLVEHDKYCKATERYGIFIDWNRSFDNQDKPKVLHHDWHDPDYWTLDVYCECQSCNKSGFTTIKVDDEFLKKKQTTVNPEPTPQPPVSEWDDWTDRFLNRCNNKATGLSITKQSGGIYIFDATSEIANGNVIFGMDSVQMTTLGDLPDEFILRVTCEKSDIKFDFDFTDQTKHSGIHGNPPITGTSQVSNTDWCYFGAWARDTIRIGKHQVNIKFEIKEGVDGTE